MKHKKDTIYSHLFLAPSAVIYTLIFLIPLVLSLFYSLTVWDFNSAHFVGLENFRIFFSEYSLNSSVIHTLIYAFLTSGCKVILAFFIAVFLTSKIKTKNFLRSVVFFPTLVGAFAIGIVFSALMHPTKGLYNVILTALGLPRIDFLGNPKLALFSVILVDVWKGVGISTVIYIAGIQSIDRDYYEAARIDGATGWQAIRYITLPLCRPARNTIIILSLIGGLRSFDLIWAMTSGGPGFATDVLSSVIYKQYAAGFYGLSTAGNVIMFVLIGLIAFPLNHFLLKQEEK